MKIFSKKGYKICRQNKFGDYISAFVLGMTTIYKKGKWTERMKDCGPLAVFDKKSTTIKYVIQQSRDGYSIFKCKYKESKEKKLYFMNTEGYQVMDYLISYYPMGTKFADKVKILKEVSVKE